MLVDKGIGPDRQSPTDAYIDGSAFADEMYYHKSQGKDITVKINTFGGRVDHGWSMIDSIIETGADTFNVGMAYSMGGVCLMFGKYRKSYSHASIMIHAPRGGSPTLVDVFKNSFRTLLESRTKFSKTEIDEMMDSGKDYFFTAKEALVKGIIDEIIQTDLQVPVHASTNELHLFYNNHIDQNKDSNMEFFNKFFGGKDESESMVNAVQMKSENEALKAEKAAKELELSNLRAKLTEAEAITAKAEHKNKAVELIENAVRANKFLNLTEEAKETLIAGAITNYDATKIMVDNMASKKIGSVSNVITSSGGKTEALTYDFLAKHKPEELKNIAENDPELFDKLIDEQLKANKQ